MKEVNILISGAGGAAAIGAIKSLQMAKVDAKIIAVDSNPLSAGFYLADKFYVVPPANDESFMSEIYKIIKTEKIDLIMPTSGSDILPLSLNKETLEEMGATCFFSDYSVVKICDSKYKFYTKIIDKFPTPTFSLYHNVGTDYPVIVKPDSGKGSRDTYLCQTEATMVHIMARHENMLICEYLPGKEYTIDVLSDLHGRTICAIPRERIETKAGVSSKGRVLKDRIMENSCKDLAEHLGLKGPSCMQMKEDKDGTLKFLEVNPRMGGGTIMAAYAGVNIPHLMLKMYNQETINEHDLEYKDTTVLRYFEEIVL